MAQPVKYYASFIISLAFQQILMIELFRAYLLVKCKYTKEMLVKKRFCYEKRLMHQFWTNFLEKDQIDAGNTYMVRERARWSII